MNKIGVFFFFFLSSNLLFSQNLVKNPCFEEYWEVQQGLNYRIYHDYPAKYWYHRYNGFYSTPDHYIKDNEALALNVPINSFGYHPAQCGNAYAGLILFTLGNCSGSRELLTGTLKEPLKAGKDYNINFYLRLAGNSNPFYTKKIEMVFNSDSAMFVRKPYADMTEEEKSEMFRKYDLNTRKMAESVITDENLFFKTKLKADIVFDVPVDTDTIMWQRVNYTYTAKGGELFFTIGLFYQGKRLSRSIKRFVKKRNINNYEEQLKRIDRRFGFLVYNENYEPTITKRRGENILVGPQYIYYFIDNVSIVPVERCSTLRIR